MLFSLAGSDRAAAGTHCIKKGMIMSRTLRRAALFLPILLLLALALPAYAQGQSPGDKVRALVIHADEGIAAADANQAALLRAEYEEIHAIWESFEDEVRSADPTAYIELEGALAAIKDAVAAQPIDPAAAKVAYTHLKDEANEIADRLGGAAVAPALAAEPASLPDAMQRLDSAYQAIERADVPAAKSDLDAFIRAWPAVEGVVAAKSQEAYTAIEIEMGHARAALETTPADLAGAEAALAHMRAALGPFAGTQAYTAFDAGLIILREGLEALLVIVALLAFLQRSGNADKRGWIWAGGALGVLASVIVAVILQSIFSSVSAGLNREVLEGVTGLFAAALLFYVSYWLHSKASLGAWRKYIDARTTQALARGSMAGLALLAFLAVFREGAETAVFYLGMAPSIALGDLLLGIGVGVGILALAAVLMLVVGVKLPLRPFFRVAGLLVYYLGFKFVGTGLHALQVAGVLPATPIAGLAPNPVFEFFGIYPTWQTLLPQLLLLAGALAAWLYLRAQDRRTLGRPAAV
jgi:high-affinity iron transporter